jgi:hypothetical protein
MLTEDVIHLNYATGIPQLVYLAQYWMNIVSENLSNDALLHDTG